MGKRREKSNEPSKNSLNHEFALFRQFHCTTNVHGAHLRATRNHPKSGLIRSLVIIRSGRRASPVRRAKKIGARGILCIEVKFIAPSSTGAVFQARDIDRQVGRLKLTWSAVFPSVNGITVDFQTAGMFLSPDGVYIYCWPGCPSFISNQKFPFDNGGIITSAGP